jgi:hypothetical protein
LSFVVLGAGTASADVVATGNVTASTVVGIGSLSSSFTWDLAPYSVFGEWDVNLGLEPGINTMAIPPGLGTVIGNVGTPPSGPFWGLWLSSNPSVLGIEVLPFAPGPGQYVCPNSVGGCASERIFLTDPFSVTYVASGLDLSGTFVDVPGGGAGLPTELGGVSVTYSFDGSQLCVENPPGFVSCSGRVNLNAFKPIFTGEGGIAGDPEKSVEVPVSETFTDPYTGETLPVTGSVTFDEVTEDAFTTVVTSSQASGSIDANFSVEVDGWTTVFSEISIDPPDAAIGPVTVCFDYQDADPDDGVVDGTTQDECSLRLLHNDDDVLTPNEFLDSTLKATDSRCLLSNTNCGGNWCIDTVNNEVCGGVDSLSTFTPGFSVGDSDGDGVVNDDDLCPDTELPDAFTPKKNRYGADENGNFVDPFGRDAGLSVADTFGCSGAQIVEQIGGKNHQTFGPTLSLLLDWIALNAP